jgi:hypothetical protein
MTLRGRVLEAYIDQDWLSDEAAFASPVLSGLTKTQIQDTLSKIKFNCKDYTVETKQDGGMTFRRVVKREGKFSSVVNETREAFQIVNGSNDSIQVVIEVEPTVNGVVMKALLKEARKVYFENVKPVFDRLRVLRGRDRSCYNIFAPGFAQDREDLKRECEVLFGLKASDNNDDLKNVYKEGKEHYNTQIQPYLITLERLLGCDRVTFSPDSIATRAIVLDREIKDFFKLLDSVVGEE